MRRILICLAVIALLAPGASSPLRAGEQDGRFDIYWVDVEGGAATLMVTPAGESILVDSGNPGRRDPQRIFDVATKVAKLTRIDHLVTTHYHGDHFGGAATLSLLLPIGTVYDNGEFEGGRERPDQAYLDFPAAKRVVINPGDELPLADAIPASGDDTALLKPTIRCLGTRQQFVDPPAGAESNDSICAAFKPKDRDGSDNANSVVLLVGFGGFRFFDAGDLTWNTEHKLVCPVNLVGEVDVYQVTHHGLDASNNPLVVRSLRPTIAVMNNGVTKGCEPETFAALKETDSIQAIYQMHKNLRPDYQNNAADEFIANLEEECHANYIKLSVDPKGETYTVSIPANGHERRFEVKGGG